MSIVVAIKHKDKIYMGSDSQSTVGNQAFYGNHKMVEKITPEGKKYIFGLVGFTKHLNLIEEMELLSDESISTIVSRIEDLFLDLEEKYDEELPMELLIATGSKLYSVDGLFSYSEVFENAQCIGSGGKLSQGYINSLENIEHPVETLKTALNVAIKGDIYCGGELFIHTT